MQLLGQYANRMIVDIDDLATPSINTNREPLDISVDLPGQYIVKYNGSVIGYGVADKGQLKSQFPKADWPFSLAEPQISENLPDLTTGWISINATTFNSSCFYYL
ncbi:MAG: hypothetical protein R3C26_02485 [Calditrichia bacterium]